MIYIKDDKGEASSIVSCDITISTNAIEGRREKHELSDLEYTASIYSSRMGTWNSFKCEPAK